MLVGYIIHGPVPGGGDTVRRCGRDGSAAGAEPGPAAPLPLLRRPPQELCLLSLVSFPLKRVVREVTGQVNLEIVGIGFVSVSCFVFYHLPVPLLLSMLSPTPCFVVSAEYSMVQ